MLTLVAGLVCAVVAAATAGRDGLLAALVGLALVLGFLLVGQLPVAQAARGRRVLATALLILLYTTRVLLLLLAFRIFTAADQVDLTSLGATVVVCALAWTAGTVWTAIRWRPMVVEPDPSAGPVVTSEMPESR